MKLFASIALCSLLALSTPALADQDVRGPHAMKAPDGLERDNKYLFMSRERLSKKTQQFYIRVGIEDAGFAANKKVSIQKIIKKIFGGEQNYAPAVFASIARGSNSVTSGRGDLTAGTSDGQRANLSSVITNYVPIVPGTIDNGRSELATNVHFLRIPYGEPEGGILSKIVKFGENLPILQSFTAPITEYSDLVTGALDIVVDNDDKTVLLSYKAAGDDRFLNEPGFFLFAHSKNNKQLTNFMKHSKLELSDGKNVRLIVPADKLKDSDAVNYLILNVEFLLYRDDIELDTTFLTKKQAADAALEALKDRVDEVDQNVGFTKPDLKDIKSKFSAFSSAINRVHRYLDTAGGSYTDCDADYQVHQYWRTEWQSSVKELVEGLKDTFGKNISDDVISNLVGNKANDKLIEKRTQRLLEAARLQFKTLNVPFTGEDVERDVDAECKEYQTFRGDIFKSIRQLKGELDDIPLNES